MRTEFAPEQLADPAMASSEAVIRKCVRCGFCTATCPTYVLLGDELDSPRGRIYLIKDMLEGERAPTAEVVKHVDRCLSCLACMTTCPSGVNYMHLIDHARASIETRYARPWPERLLRAVLARTLPYPRRFRAALALARLARPAAGLFARAEATRPLAAMLALAPERPAPAAARVTLPVEAPAQRVALLQGCVEPVLRPEIRAATLRLLARCGQAVVLVAGEGCCGALAGHMGREHNAKAAARANVEAWTREMERHGLDAIVVTASGCGTFLKNYAHLLRDEPDYADAAARIAALVRDVSEVLADLPAPSGAAVGLRVAYHAACSLQHGQRVTRPPVRLLRAAGFEVVTPAEAHLCCGSAGTYNLLQPGLAGRLGDRKVAMLDALGADVIATGNIGCAVQIGQRSATPVLHLVELLDWATGGPTPDAIAALRERT